jgi:hypothetical protein
MVSHEAPANVQKPVASENDAMTGVMPSALADLPQLPSSSLLSMHSPRHLPYMNTFLSANPFLIPLGCDAGCVQDWCAKAKAVGIPHMIMAQIAEEAGLTESEVNLFKVGFLCDPYT